MLEKGDIVKDTSSDSVFYGKQGEVVRVYSNGTTMVRFPVFMIPSHMYVWDNERKPITVWYKGKEVDDLVVEEHWDEEALTIWRAEQIWPRFHHSVYVNKEPFREGSECMVADCMNVAIKRGLINFVGGVYPVDMCQDHCDCWDEKAVETFPDLKPSQQ